MADRPGGAVAGVHRLRHAPADRLGRVALDRPDHHPGRRTRHRPGRRPRPLQPARRRDRAAGERQVLPLDHLRLPAHPVRRLRRRLHLDRQARVARRRPSSPRSTSSASPISIGCIGGIGINTAHELGHKKESHERWLSKIALAQSFYGHFYIEHNRGHHVRVATPEDPASSRLGENFYQFWPRTVARLAEERLAPGEEALRPQGQAPLPDRQRRAQRLADVGGALGRADRRARAGRSCPLLVVQAVVGFSLLEVVNYMEHYGMLRQKVGVGERQRYERVDPSHSWNSNNIATNVLLYHLQRHSDHHANPTRRYQALRDFEESPVLPTGYAGMIVLAIVPAVWRRVMDPRVRRPLRRRPHAGQHQPRASGSGSWPGTASRRPRSPAGSLARDHVPSRRSLDAAPDHRGGARRALPRVRLHLRGRPAATSTRASRPAPPGPTYPTPGAARTAACARRSTSCPSTSELAS